MINTEITTTKGMEQAQKKVEQAKRLYAQERKKANKPKIEWLWRRRKPTGMRMLHLHYARRSCSLSAHLQEEKPMISLQ